MQEFRLKVKCQRHGYASRGAARFGPLPYFVQYVYQRSPQTHGVFLALFADDTCLYATDRKEGFVVRKLQHGLSSMEAWCVRWNVKINEDKTQGIYFSQSRRPPESHFTLN
jgi:hypothetical protein